METQPLTYPPALKSKGKETARTNIVFVLQHFYPEMAGSALRLAELADGLSKKKFEVTVFTGIPTYSDFLNVPKIETRAHLMIYRFGILKLNKNSRSGRILTSIDFFASALIQLMKRNKDELLLVGSDPPFLCLIGWLLNKIRGQKFILHIADLYPEIAVELGYLKRGGVLEHLWNQMNRICISKAERVITVGNFMKQRLLEREKQNGNAEQRIEVIQNWEDEELIQPLAKEDNWFAREHHLLKKTVVLYAGNMGLAHDLVSVFEAARILATEKDILFLFVGGGGQQKHLTALKEKNHLENITFLPYQPREYSRFVLTAGDIGLVTMKPRTEGLCVPSKFYSTLASGLAVLAVVPKKTEVAELIDVCQCGICVEPLRPEQIVQAVLKLHHNKDLLNTMQKRARMCFEERFTKEKALQEHMCIFEDISNCSVQNHIADPVDSAKVLASKS